MFLFTDGTLIDDNAYLETLPIWTKLLICTSDEKDQILSFFRVKRGIEALYYDSYQNVENYKKIISKEQLFK